MNQLLEITLHTNGEEISVHHRDHRNVVTSMVFYSIVKFWSSESDEKLNIVLLTARGIQNLENRPQQMFYLPVRQ